SQASSVVRDGGVGVVEPHDVIFGGAETLHAAGTSGGGVRLNEVLQRSWSGRAEGVTTLRSGSHSGGQLEVNDASGSRNRTTSRATCRSRRPKGSQAGSIDLIGSLIG